ILVFTMSPSQSRFEIKRIKEEGRKIGIYIERWLYNELIFKNNQVFLGKKEVDESNTLGVIFRAAGTISGKYVEGRNLLISYLSDKVKCLNAAGYLNWPRMGKIPQLGVFLKNKVPVIPTKIFYRFDQVLAENFEFPIVVKDSLGYQGKGVERLNSLTELKIFLKKLEEKDLGIYLWQKYLPVNWDIRVIVLGGKVLGAMKRTAVGEEFRSNFSLGGKVEKWDLAAGDREIAEKVAKICYLDYAGIDIIHYNGKSYVLEVNRQCQFKGFEKATGINVAKELIAFFLK
ncbi:MAG TPA: ATP-grasp domain-containing protein, partial [Candidatus Woesebacteria bacterium]|nr:ATP-grasp domain-containing protein [Candidatus Woesebacteria bacterium]